MEATSRTKAPHIQMDNVHLLIADDNRDTLDLLATRTELQGWKGTYVTSASGIIEAINENPSFDAVIADVNYYDNQPGPRLTGMTAAREIRKVHADLPIIFITAFSGSTIREEIRRLGAELMTKPFDLEELFSRVYQLVYWYRACLRADPSWNGIERRSTSINLTSFRRRANDEKIAPNRIIKSVLEDLRNEAI